jgi:hypothetical protein
MLGDEAGEVDEGEMAKSRGRNADEEMVRRSGTESI